MSFSTMPIEELAGRWCTLQYLGIKDLTQQSQMERAYFDHLPHEQPERAFALALAVLKSQAHLSVVMHLNNRLMSALLMAHGVRLAEKIEAAARGNQRLRWLLGGSYWWVSDRPLRARLETIADEDSVTFLRPKFAPELVTALARIEGRAVGVIANNTMVSAGALTAAASDKAARFLQLCNAFELPVVSLIDCPGYMVGPSAEAEALVRRGSRMLVAGAALRVPLVAVILRRGYGLGAQAMCGGGLHEPLLTVAWPGAHLGPMGLEGAVRLGMRKELEAIADDDEREERVRQATAAAQQNAKALNAAALFEIDDVIDPAATRSLIAATFAAATAYVSDAPRPRFVDTW